jgi:hypothetical protein
MLPALASAQETRRFDVGVQAVTATARELDDTDLGVSVRAGWRLSRLFGVEAEAGYFPSDLGDPRALSASRTELLAGVTAGVSFGRFRPFARLRPGLLRIAEAPEPVPCILIYPPPLVCTLAGGKTLFVVDVGGGVEAGLTERTFLRLDVGDRLTRYPGPAFGRGRRVHGGTFSGHDLRVAVGAGWRF